MKVVLHESEWWPCYEEHPHHLDTGMTHGEVEIEVHPDVLDRWQSVMADFDTVQKEMEQAYSHAMEDEADNLI